MLNSRDMKKIKQIILVLTVLLFLGGCDKDFVEINTDPFAITEIDPALLFAGAQRVGTLGGYESESTIVQHFVNPFNEGATKAFNFNADIDGFQTGPFNLYGNAIKHYVHILNELEGTTTRVNLQSMTRIMKAYVFMNIVDHHGDVPYFNAGLAAISGEGYFFPEYDDDEAIYEDLYTEITEALANFDPEGDYVSADLFYGLHAYSPVNNATVQVEKWKKFGNSLLLRLGMRYSKVAPTKAEQIVKEAFAGGVMTSNADNALVTYDGTNFINNANNNLINLNPRFWYAAEPFVNHLKATQDPRSKYLIALYADPNDPLGDANPNYNLADQFGVPVGVEASSLGNLPYRGQRGGGYNYSQFNVKVVSSISAPSFWFTYSQTALLLAEAAQRGWITGSAQTYYEDGIRADMRNYDLYLAETASSLAPLTDAEINTYLAQPGVAFNAENAYELINTAYWVVNIRDASEAWANLRRSGYPVLSPNTFTDDLRAFGGDGFVHRFSYPDGELSRNKANYQAAVALLDGGTDNLVSRVFWDIP